MTSHPPVHAIGDHPVPNTYVVFIPRMAVAAWWARRLRFQHCYLAWRADGATLLLHHEGLHLRVQIAPETVEEHADRLMREKAATVFLAAPSARPGRPMLRPPMTCVEVCKAALGIAAPWIITPGQLARHLAKLGAPRLRTA